MPSSWFLAGMMTDSCGLLQCVNTGIGCSGKQPPHSAPSLHSASADPCLRSVVFMLSKKPTDLLRIQAAN